MRTAGWVTTVWMLGWVAQGALAEPAFPVERLEVYPQQFSLVGPYAGVQLVVTAYGKDGRLRDVTRECGYQIDEPSIVRVERGWVSPVADGSARIVVEWEGSRAEAVIQVTQANESERVSFTYGTLVALTKHGCNSGACHGSPSGKGGFRLSLRAFDPALDQVTLIREEFGRRINPFDPEESLLLRKPTMKLPHGGGLRLTAHDPAYRLLRDWIGQGGQLDPQQQPACVRLEVFPASGRVLHLPEASQQLAVWAHFSDGSVRDVTPLASFSSSDESVAEVDERGLVVGHNRGEAAILIRYADQMETCFLTFLKEVEGFTWNDPPQYNYIDEIVDAKLKKLHFLPSELAGDEEFLRRVYLDVVGHLPSVEEVRAFLADPDPQKRSRLIDQLLERPEFARYWALRWGDILRLTVGQVGADGVYKYHRWLEQAWAQNMPYDQFARELLGAAGGTLTHPPANFYRTTADENDCVEAVAQIFLGARLQCAKCHNHPFEKWTQDNYYGMAAFFNRVKKKPAARPGELLVYVARTGEVVQPRTGRQMKPWLPGRGEIDVELVDRRQAFIDWLTAPDNPLFARVEVNRIWSYLFGRGIVDPPDDFRESNPPAHEELLEALARDFVQHGFDRKHIIRTILNSRIYQTTFRPNPWNEEDEKYFSHQQPRMLSAEQLLDAICFVTGVPEKFGPLPAGTLATHLPAPDLVKHEFLKIFGQPERQTVCACERTTESNLGMAIQFFNGPLIYEKLRDEKNRFRVLASAGHTDEEIVTELYLAALCRMPSAEELQAAMEHVAAKRKQFEDERTSIEQQLAELSRQMEAVRQGVAERVRQHKFNQVPEPLRDDLKKALDKSPDERNDIERYLVDKLGNLITVSQEEINTAITDEEKQKIKELSEQSEKLRAALPAESAYRMVALEDICWAILNTNEFLFQH
ncbi:MAG: surface protein [Pirellulaceae bacterium]|nr:MAG: surface protein [Pirellulaceae bacterium]